MLVRLGYITENKVEKNNKTTITWQTFKGILRITGDCPMKKYKIQNKNLLILMNSGLTEL